MAKKYINVITLELFFDFFAVHSFVDSGCRHIQYMQYIPSRGRIGQPTYSRVCRRIARHMCSIVYVGIYKGTCKGARADGSSYTTYYITRFRDLPRGRKGYRVHTLKGPSIILHRGSPGMIVSVDTSGFNGC